MFSLRLSLFCGDFVAPFPSNLGVLWFESPCVEFTLASGVDISFGATNLPPFVHEIGTLFLMPKGLPYVTFAST